MTSDQQRQFEHLWPGLSVRLHRLLSRKKVSRWLVEDLVQETGLRLIRMWPEIDQTKPLWPLTATIALNLLRDELRRAGSKESIQTLPDSPSAENVETRGMARVELRAVGGALAQMPAPQRDAILADLSAGTDETPLASSARMMRMRARRRLQHLMDHASVLGVAVAVQMRRAMRELELVIGRVIPTDAERATAAAISLLAAISVGVAVAPSPESADGGATRAAPEGRTGVVTEMPTVGSTSLALAASTAEGSLEKRARGQSRRATPLNDPRAASRNSGGTSDEVEQDEDFPGTTQYSLEVTEDTYFRGGLGVEVIGAGKPNRDDGSLTRSPVQLSCAIAPSHTGASCMVGDGGSEYTGVRARYRGEARVLGRRIQ